MKRPLYLGFGLLSLLTGCLPFHKPERPTTPPVGLRPDRTSLDPLTLLSASGTRLIVEELRNCPANAVDIPGEGSRVKGSIGGLAVAPNPVGTAPSDPSAVGKQIYAEAEPERTAQAAIIVVDDFNGDAEQGSVYFLDQQDGQTLAGLQGGTTEAEIAGLEAARQYSHGALVFNHTLALLNAADRQAAGNAVGQAVLAPSLRRFDLEVFTPTERKPLAVPAALFPRLGVTVAALDTEDFDTKVIGARLSATIQTLAQQQGIRRFAVNLSFGLVPCSVLADFGASRRQQPDLTFESYLQDVLDANSLDANAFRADLTNILTTPVGTDPLLVGEGTDLEQTGAATISYIAAAGNYGLPYSLFPAYWSEFVGVSAQNMASAEPVKDPDYSNTGEVLMPGGYYRLTAYDPRINEFVSYPNLSIAGTSFSAPALSVFTALDFTRATPHCLTPDPVSPLAFFKTDPPVPTPLPDLDLPLGNALRRYCPVP